MLPDISIITPIGRYEPEYLTDAYHSIVQLVEPENPTDTPLTVEWILALDIHDVNPSDIISLFPSSPFPVICHHPLHSTPQGPGTARNTALHYATAPLLLSLDSDDILIPEGTRTLRSILLLNPQYSYAAGRTCDIDEQGNFLWEGPPPPYREGLIPKEHFYRHRARYGSPPFHPCGTIMRTDVIKNIGGWPEGWTRTEDTALWSVLTHHYLGAWSNEYVLKYRKHSTSITHQPDYHGDATHLLPRIAEFVRRGTTRILHPE